jgi:hypothetical protein
MKKFYSLLHNPDVQGAILITLIISAIIIAFIFTLGK